MLALVAATIGMLVVLVRDTADVRVLSALLAGGQVLSHLVLGTGGHVHATAAVPWALMIAAHVAAVITGTGLIAAGGHLCATASRVLRAAAQRTRRPVTQMTRIVADSADQPLQSALSLAASMSHRGPPVSIAH